MPRELAPGIFWLPNCSVNRQGPLAVHSYNSVYVVSGDERSLVFDTGHPKDWRSVERQLDELIAGGIAPVGFVLPSHAETVHAANLGRLLAKFPDAVAVGDVRDYHLVFPELADRLSGSEAGERIDLGGREVEVLDAVFHDSLTTRWAYDATARTLFTADGFAYLHFHEQDQCGKTVEELPDLPVEELTGYYGEFAFYWTRFVDIEPHVAELERLLADRDVAVIAPGHGAPILDPAATVPTVLDGMRLGRRATREEIFAELIERTGG